MNPTRTRPAVAMALAAIALTAAAIFLWAEGAGRADIQLFAKPWPVLAMIALLGRAPGSYGRKIQLGLGASVVGDVLLEGGDELFLAGVGAFLVAHLFYIAAFVGKERGWYWWRAVPFVAWGAGVLVWLWPGLVEAEMAIPVGVYTAVICTMMWRASARLGRRASNPVILAAGGALLFAASDSLIAIGRFGEPFASMPYLIIVLYWLGQAGITLSAYLDRG